MTAGDEGAGPGWRVLSTHAVRFAARPETVRTLEGPVRAAAGDAIVTGILGEQWPVPLADFRERYAPPGGATLGEAGRYLRRGEPVTARPIEAGEASTGLDVAGGRLTGSPGDFVVRDADGRERIVARDVFARTFVWDSPGRAGPATAYRRFERDLHRTGPADAALAALGRAGAAIDRAFRRILAAPACAAAPAIDEGRRPTARDEGPEPAATVSRRRVDALAARYAGLAGGGIVLGCGSGAAAVTAVCLPFAAGWSPAAPAASALALTAAALLAALLALRRAALGWQARAVDYGLLADALRFRPAAGGEAGEHRRQALEPGGPWWAVVAEANAPDAPAAADLPAAIRRRGRQLEALASTSAAAIARGRRLSTILLAAGAVGAVFAALSGSPAGLIATVGPVAWAAALQAAIHALGYEREQSAAAASGAELARLHDALQAGTPDALDRALTAIRTASLRGCMVPH